VKLAALAFVLPGVVAGAAHAQDQESQASTRTLPAGERYEAGAVHRFFLGSGYRKLWTQPITAPVLDLATFSGGLVAEKKGGGRQTKSLKLEGKDGREWKFRSIDKDPTTVLPSTLQKTFAASIVQDQISASHPAGALVVDALLDAAGIPHVNHTIVVLPDDARLGDFRKEFAGMLGTLEEHRGRGFARAVVLRAAQEAERAGHDFVFLLADDFGWTKTLYAKLGFDPVGKTYEFSLRPTD
jgi:GNAT superfamily N-acetyltransferase